MPTSPSSAASSAVRPSSSARWPPADSPQAAIRSGSMPSSSARARSQRTAALASCSWAGHGRLAGEPVVDARDGDAGLRDPLERASGEAPRYAGPAACRLPSRQPPPCRKTTTGTGGRRLRRQDEVELQRADARDRRVRDAERARGCRRGPGGAGGQRLLVGRRRQREGRRGHGSWRGHARSRSLRRPASRSPA